MTFIFKRSTLGLLAGGVLAAGLLVWAVWPAAQPVETAPLVTGDYVRELVEEARTRVRERYTVAAPLAGLLLRPTLDVGDRVEAGQVIAQIVPAAPALLDARTRAAQAEHVAAAQASLARAQAQQAQARLAVQQARDELQRQQGLAAQGFVSPALLESLQRTLQQREQALAMAGHDVQASRHALQALRIGLMPPEPAAGGNLQAVAVRAPVAGRVLRRHIGSAGPVAAGAALLDMGDPASLEVVSELLTEDAFSLPAGARATLSLSGQGPQWPAQLRHVEPAASTRVSALGVQEQRTLAVLESPQLPTARLGDGYRLTVRIVTESAQAVPLAPVSAVFAHGSGHAVFVFDQGRARLQAVELVSRNGEQAWLRTPLAPGTRLILYPDSRLQDGDRVSTR